MGQSFGGYFVLYSLFHQSATQTNDFKNFISASPTLWCNDFYLNKLPDQLLTNEKNIGLFLSVGELEDSTWSVNLLKKPTKELQDKQIKGLDFKSRIFNHLDHMECGCIIIHKGVSRIKDFKINSDRRHWVQQNVFGKLDLDRFDHGKGKNQRHCRKSGHRNEMLYSFDYKGN